MEIIQLNHEIHESDIKENWSDPNSPAWVEYRHFLMTNDPMTQITLALTKMDPPLLIKTDPLGKNAISFPSRNPSETGGSIMVSATLRQFDAIGLAKCFLSNLKSEG